MRPVVLRAIKPISGAVFGVFVDILAVAISAFDPALVLWNLKPDPRMAKRAFAAITSNPVAVHDFGFGGFDCHQRLILLVGVVCLLL